MNELAIRLPSNVIQIIIPYTYKPQSRELCRDIRSYYTIIHDTRKQYHKLYPGQIPFISGDEADEWLSNDICRFLNNDIPTMYGYHTFYIETYSRLHMNKTKDVTNMVEYITKIDDKLFPRDIKIVIGLLNPDEREKLIKFLRF
jgi:hypothetical protein